MQFNYSKTYLNRNLIFSGFQILLGGVAIIFQKMGLFFQLGFLFAGIVNLINNFSFRANAYLKIENTNLLIHRSHGYKKNRFKRFY